MLILSRKAGEGVLVEGGIRIVILECERNGVRIGIEAPAEVPIYRHEIWAAIKEENRAAAEAGVERMPSTRNRQKHPSNP